MTKKNPFAREDLLTDCTKFYESKTRKNKYGNKCDLCHEDLEGKCMRAIWGINQFGNNNYTTVHHECFKKALVKEIPKSIQAHKNIQVEYNKNIRALKKLL